MLIKTLAFHKQFLRDLASIVLKSKTYREQLESADTFEMKFDKQLFRSVKFIGSYIEKPYGSIITDIDMFQLTRFDDSFSKRMQQIFTNLNKSNFIFVRFYCGENSILTPPWIIDGTGSCMYSLLDAEMWLKLIEPILKDRGLEDVYNKIWVILSKNTISLSDLITVEKLIEPHASIMWSKEDIQNGYKMIDGERIDFLTTIQNYSKKKTLKFIYKYGKEYCLVDMSLRDFTKKDVADNITMRSYYEGDTYKIIKMYKRYMKPEYADFYKKEFRQAVGNLTGLAGRLELISKAKKYKLLEPAILKALEDDCKEYAKIYNIPTINEDELQKIIYKNTAHLEKLFKERIVDDYKMNIYIYELRAVESRQQILKDVLQQRVLDGNDCPFFPIHINDIKRLYDICKRALLDIQQVITCLYESCVLYKQDPFVEAKKLFDNTDLYIEKSEGGYTLKQNKEIIKSVDSSHLKQLQLNVLYGI